MTTVLLDTHVLLWWSSDEARISRAAGNAIASADSLAVASITWFELAWLAVHGRIMVPMAVGAWLERLAADVHSVPITPAIAERAAALPSDFPGDPADRLIYATAIETGWPLISKDRRLRGRKGGVSTVW